MDTGNLNELCHLFAAHLRAVAAAVPVVRNAIFVINIESNLAYVADTLAAYLAATPGLPRTHVLREDRRRSHSSALGGGGGAGSASDVDPIYTAGTRTTARLKREMVEVMRTVLRAELLYFMRPAPVSAHLDRRAVGAALPRDAIVTQVGDFKRELIYPKAKGRSTTPRARETFSGKFGTKQDDWVMALMIAIFCCELFNRTTLRGGARL